MAELFGCPFKGWRGGGWGSNFTYVSYNTGMCRPNEDDLISHQIQPLGTRREVGALTLFHRMYYGEAPELLCQLLPEHLQLDPRLRRSVRSHDLAVQIPRSNLVSHKRSFVPSAARIWNSLPEYIPSLEKRACFKKGGEPLSWRQLVSATFDCVLWYFCVLLLMP